MTVAVILLLLAVYFALFFMAVVCALGGIMCYIRHEWNYELEKR